MSNESLGSEPELTVDDEREINATEDWREVTEKMTSLSEKYQYMLEHDILTDCTFVVGPEDGETREFKAHRLHIARVSAVFEVMLLRSEMMEAKTGHVKVTDFSPNTFQLLLSSIYGKNPEMTTFQEAQDLAFAAHKYQMKALLETCVTRMMRLISPENIWTALETADLLQENRLEKTCVQVMKCDTLRYITHAGFMQASEENVALLLEQDELNVDDELLLVNIIVHWARHAARQRGLSDDDNGVRAVLEPRLLSLFRLLAMSPHHFTFGPGLAGWLTSDEKAIISECLQSKDVSELPQHLSSVTQKRKIVTDVVYKEPFDMLICAREIIGFSTNKCQPGKQCCGYYDSHLGNWGSFHEYYHCFHATLIFRVKSNCQWWGFQRRSQCRKDHSLLSAKNLVCRETIVVNTYTFKHTLSTDFSRTRIRAEKSYEQESEYNSTTTVMFDKPIPLVTDNWFALEVIFRQKYNPLGYYPNHERAPSVCTEAGVEFVFQTKQQIGYHTSKNEGLIESLIFSL